MALTLQNIIDQADALMENPFVTSKKVEWLNQINQEFFEVVKVPEVATISTVSGQSSYTLTSAVRARNIRSIIVGQQNYMSMQYDEGTTVGRNVWSYSDLTNTLTLSPAPATADTGIIRYFHRGSTTFTVGALTVNPDAPEEYHSLYVYGLAERIAKAYDDIAKANNFSQEYQAGLLIAQQNYAIK